MSEIGKVRNSVHLPEVTRLTVVVEEGVLYDEYNLYKSGVEIHLQDDGRTLKIFPRRVND